MVPGMYRKAEESEVYFCRIELTVQKRRLWLPFSIGYLPDDIIEVTGILKKGEEKQNIVNLKTGEKYG